jgi:tRNA dimethylallyltransferase
LLVLVGPTASGKSAVALEVAERIGARIVSLDSMQVYRGMDIGTAKPSAEERERVPHAMIDLVEPSVEYTVAEFQAEARCVIETSDRPVILAGGSGLHMRAVLDPLEFLPTDGELRTQLEDAPLGEMVDELLRVDADAGRWVDLANRRRVVRAVEVHRLTGRTPSEMADDPRRKAVQAYASVYSCRIIGLDPGEALAARVERRLQAMLAAGLYEEVAGLEGSMGRTASLAVGYRELARAVRGEATLEEAVAAVKRSTLALARRQRTWFRRDPRVEWIDPLRTDAVATVMAPT